MKKLKIWKATDDERLLAESGKIYRVGFWLLAAGILLDILMKAAMYLPAWVGEAGIFPLLGLESLVLVAALVLCALLAAGRGILTLGADPVADHFPAKHYALVSLGLGLGLSVISLLLRAVFHPHWEFGPGALILVLGLIVLFVTGATFAVCFGTLYLFFRIARRRRRHFQEPKEK